MIYRVRLLLGFLTYHATQKSLAAKTIDDIQTRLIFRAIGLQPRVVPHQQEL